MQVECTLYVKAQWQYARAVCTVSAITPSLCTYSVQCDCIERALCTDSVHCVFKSPCTGHIKISRTGANGARLEYSTCTLAAPVVQRTLQKCTVQLVYILSRNLGAQCTATRHVKEWKPRAQRTAVFTDYANKE